MTSFRKRKKATTDNNQVWKAIITNFCIEIALTKLKVLIATLTSF